MGIVESRVAERRSSLLSRTSTLNRRSEKGIEGDGEEHLLASEDDHDPSCSIGNNEDGQTSYPAASPNSPELSGKAKRGTTNSKAPDTKLKDVIVTLKPGERVELQKKVDQLAKCARSRKYEVTGLVDAALGSFKTYSDGSNLWFHMCDWDRMARELTEAKLGPRCGMKTLTRFEHVHEQCIQGFRDFDIWIQESYDLIEGVGVDMPTAASATKLRSKICPGGEALRNRLLALHGKLELISKDLFENWRRH